MKDKRKRLKKQILAWVLAFVMVFELGLTPVANTQAMQMDNSIEQQDTSVQQNNSESTETISEATEVVWNGQLIEKKENHYIIKNSGYNRKLTKGQSVEIGFQGKPGNVQNGPYNYELLSYEDLKLELEPPVLILDGTGEYPVLKWNQVDGATTYIQCAQYYLEKLLDI